ncbi:MAG: peroxiredoxin [Muribaculaceae bacterium]|nr:peroxiredoxin [Muribaculaceae bacterium]
MNIGDKMPDILGKDANGNEIRLSSFPESMKFIIYFYPKDSTPGCTAEAISFRQNYDTFLKMGYQVIGVSKDSEQSHRKFIDKNCLPFPLVSDVDTSLCQKAGVWQLKKMAGREYMGIVRTTFVCDHDGTVTDVVNKVNTKLAAEQLFKLLDGRGAINPAP